jgi:hypothetical protein
MFYLWQKSFDLSCENLLSEEKPIDKCVEDIFYHPLTN